MKFWQKWLSYLYDIEVETIDSDINGLLSLYISNGEYQLCTKDAIYSWGLKYYNFLELFPQINLPADHSNVLILGMGMGSIPLILEKKLNKQYNYTAVEYDESIVYLASKYSLPELQSPIDIITTDAEVYVEMDVQKYEMICVDIFLNSSIPPQFKTSVFLEKIKDRLAPNGKVIMNCLYHYPQDQSDTEDYYQNVFQSVFKESETKKTYMNLMLIGKT